MAGNLIELRRRIKSVNNTQKITRAMKTVSAAKLRKTVVELNRARPYLRRVEGLLRRLTRDVDPSRFPLMEEHEKGDDVLVVLSSDKGLCGSFNSHILREMEVLLARAGEEKRTLRVVTMGNRGSIYVKRLGIDIAKNFPGIMSRTSHEDAREVMEYLRDLFLNEGVRDISFLYTGFRSTSRQEVVCKSLFPVRCQWNEVETDPEEKEQEFIYEPSAEAIFEATLPFFLESRIYHLLIESQASEHAARMLAMDLATRNASDMIHALTLTMNKMRQASITNELLEIITATEALQSK